MAKKDKDQELDLAEESQEAKPAEKPQVEDRIDAHAIGIFAALGYSGRLPDSLVATYKFVKAKKDIIQPGRLSPEGFAVVALMSDMSDGRFNLGKE